MLFGDKGVSELKKIVLNRRARFDNPFIDFRFCCSGETAQYSVAKSLVACEVAVVIAWCDNKRSRCTSAARNCVSNRVKETARDSIFGLQTLIGDITRNSYDDRGRINTLRSNHSTN